MFIWDDRCCICVSGGEVGSGIWWSCMCRVRFGDYVWGDLRFMRKWVGYVRGEGDGLDTGLWNFDLGLEI